MISDVLVCGSGSAGLMVALALKKKAPQLRVRIVRDPGIGVIGVGEGTTMNFPNFIFDYLGIRKKDFYRMAEPSWKLGIRFKWGPRGKFDFTFTPQLDARRVELPRPNGFYCHDEFSAVDLPSALMDAGKVFPAQANGCPNIQPWHGFHIENDKLVETLERFAIGWGCEIIDGCVTGTERNDQGVKAVCLEDGRKLEADLFVDCSGFRSELLGKTLAEPFESFGNTLFCDRAVVGGWERSDEPILPYTTAEQMSSGWCWRIEHEHHINRGYVYCADLISDDEAEAEFRRLNPKLREQSRIVKFRSGCYRRGWVDTVVAIGNAFGFVEPLEATALSNVVTQIQLLVEVLLQCEMVPTPLVRSLYNDASYQNWHEIRDFLGLHYKLNTSLDTPFWKRCREETDLSGLQAFLEFYEENGPTGLGRYHLGANSGNFSKEVAFGLEGHLVMMVGQKAPYRHHRQAPPEQWVIWERGCQQNRSAAQTAMTIEQAFQYVRHPGWEWFGDQDKIAFEG